MVKKAISSRALLCSLVAVSVQLVNAQDDSDYPVSSWPHAYPGMPSGDFSPEWQDYFQVTEKLTNVTWDLGKRNWAGNIPVNRPGHPNDTLFFWGFEKDEGSFTDENSSEPWGIWIEGPTITTSTMVDFTSINGPIQIAPDYSVSKNDYSLDRIADWVWVDEILDSGYSTKDADSAVTTADQVAEDFLGFLDNLVKVFPGLKTRPLHLGSESFGGKFISYIAKQYFSMENPPVNLKKIAIGRGILTSSWGNEQIVPLIETFPQLINYDPEAYEYIKEQARYCGYEFNFTYPQTGGKFPTPLGDQEDRHDPRINGSHYCDLEFNVGGYARNFSMPYKIATWGNLPYPADTSVMALTLYEQNDPSVFFNDPATRAALHAPTSRGWEWGPSEYLTAHNDGDDAIVFFDELAANATAHNVSIVLYGRNDDAWLTPKSTELVIQNTTFGGIQGFSRKPSTPWTDDNGNFAGIVHQERGWTYVLVNESGWFLPDTAYERTTIMFREFVIGNNQTGLVTTSPSGEVTVIGGEDPDLYLRGTLAGPISIPYLINGTLHEYAYPDKTREAWEAYTQSAIPTVPITGA